MRNPITVPSNGATVYVDVNRSGNDLVSRLAEALTTAGLSPSDVGVTIQE
jgi:RecA-family ATPase